MADERRLSSRRSKLRGGAVRAIATYALPPCRGVVVVRATKTHRIIGRASLTIDRPGIASTRIVLSRGARAQLVHGARLRTELTLGARTSDGTSEQAGLAVLLHA